MQFSKKQSISTTVPSDSPVCEIITIGSELLLGQIMDTNTTYLAQELGRTGIKIRFRTAVGDPIEEIKEVIRNAVERCDMVLVTGGLGPTLDDLTRDAVAQVAGVDLEFRQDLMNRIEQAFRRSGYNMPENNRRQAFVPEGSHAIPNPVGTAPGFIKDIDGKPVMCLPGVPRELKYLLSREALPWLRNRFKLIDHQITYKVLKTAGIAESKVDRIIGDLILPGQNPEVGLLALQGGTEIRIAARAKNEGEAYSLIDPVEMEIRSRLGKKIYGQGNDSLEGVIESLLAGQNLTIAIIETFSAGLAAQKFHQLPSRMLVESRVIPDEEHLIRWLGKENRMINNESAPSLAQKVYKACNADVGLAILGFPKKGKHGYTLEGRVATVGAGIQNIFSWQMGGNLLTLQNRGAAIGLNTLRLALIEKFG